MILKQDRIGLAAHIFAQMCFERGSGIVASQDKRPKATSGESEAIRNQF
jgi:hypothetical protein